MTISATTPKIIYLPNGTQTVFTVPFTFFDDDDLVVTEKLEASPYTEVVLVLNTDYTVTGGDGAVGSITLSTATLATKKLIILSELADVQGTDYINNSDYDQNVLEASLDKIVRMIQQKDEIIDRCLKFDIGADSVELPTDGSGYLYYNGTDFSLDDLTYTTTDYAGTITAGVDASKPASPSAKDIYYALDTKKRYLCVTAGSWDYDGVFYDVTVGGDLGVTGDTTLTGTLGVTGDVTVADMSCSGTLSLATGALDGFLDEDTLSSDSATEVASQQSVKAYVDASAVTIKTGTVAHAGTIPLPSGYDEADCYWMVSHEQYYHDDTIGGSGEEGKKYHECSVTASRVVTCRTSVGSYGSNDAHNGTANYIIIGKK